jgi:predicted MFS family arabinose efflux permease
MDNQEEHVSHKLRDILSSNFTFTKRQVGIVLFVMGVLGFIGVLAIDFVGGGREGGIGPSQQAALVLLAFVALIGLSLIPLGNKPA